MASFDFEAFAGKPSPGTDTTTDTTPAEGTVVPAAEVPSPVNTGFDFDAFSGRSDPKIPGVGGVPFEPLTDPLGRPLKEQPQPRQWSVFGTPLPGTLAAEKNLTIHPASRAVLQNFDLTSDISANSAALKKIVKGVYGQTLPNNRLGRIPVDDLTDDQLRKIIEQPRVERALQLDSVTRRRMAEDAEEAAILRGELPIMLSAEGAVNTMMRMMAPPETRTPEAIVAQQDRGFVSGLLNMPTLEVLETIQGVRMRGTMARAARAEAARKGPWSAFVDVFEEQVGPRGIRADTVIPYVWNPIDVAYGITSGLTRLGEVYLAGGFNEETAARLEAEASSDIRAISKELKRIAAEYPSGKTASNYMKAVADDPRFYGAVPLAFKDPRGFFAASAEVFARNVPRLAASAMATAASGPIAGITVSTLSTFTIEDLRPDEQRTAFLKEKTGIDLNTSIGQQLFLKDKDAQRIYKTYGRKRAEVIAAVDLLSLGYLRGPTIIPAKSLTGKLAERTVVTSLLEGVGEGFAGYRATGKVDLKEAFLESVLGFGQSVPGTILEGYVAGSTDIKRARDAKRATVWLEGSTELKGQIAGIPVVKLDTAASVLGEKLADGGFERVYIVASELDRFDQDGNVAQTLGLDRSDVQRAAAEGEFVEVTASAFVRHILGKDGFDALIEHTAFDPTGMTPAEAAQYEAAGIGDQIQQQIEERARARLSPGLDDASLSKLDADMGSIQDQVAAQLEATGRYDANKSRLFGLLTAQRYATRAIRRTEETGRPVDARALFDADNLQITGRARVQPTGTLEQAQQGFADPRIPELEQAARDRSEGRITQEAYQAVVDQYKPVLPYESVPEPATDAEMRGALASNKVGRLGKGGEFVGQGVGLRLDIPAYTQKGVWVPTIHNPQGKPVAHEAAARITNATFTEPGDAAETAAGKVGRGEKGKAPFAQINGTLESVDPAELKAAADAALNDPAWTQVGYDPRRHTFFYDRKTQQPVLSADEVIQVGPLVLAKNAQFGDAGTFLFQDDANEQLNASSNLDDAQSDVIARIESAGGEVLEFTQIDGLVDLDQVPVLTLQDLEGMRIFPTVADRTAAAALYTGIEGAELDVAIPLLGGPLFPLRVSNWANEVVWANRGASVTGAKEGKITEGKATHMLVVLGDPNMHISNTTVTTAYFKTLLAALQNPESKFDADAAQAFTELMQTWEGAKLVEPQRDDFKTDDAFKKANKNYRDNLNIRNGVNGFPGFSDPAAIIDHLHDISFEARKKIMQIAGSKKASAITGVNMQKVLNATREQSLSGAGWGDGVLLLELDTENTFVELGQGETTQHPDFPLGMRGKVAGRFETPIAWQVLWQDYVAENADKDNIRRAFELSRPIVEVTPELLQRMDNMGPLASPGIDTRAHAAMVSDAVSKRWSRGGVAVKDGGLGAAEFIDAMDIATDGLINKLREKATGKDGLNAAIKGGDISKVRIAKLAKHHVYYGMERVGDDMQLSALVNNDSGTYGIGETLAVLDALDNGATTAVADPSSVTYNILRDLGFDPDGDVLRWNGDSNARGSLTERYIGGRLTDVLGERGAKDEQELEGSSRSQSEVDAGGRGEVRPEDVERDPSVTGADSATSRARAIAERISGLSPLARENLGLTEQDQANVAALTGGPDVLFQQQAAGQQAARGGFTPSDLITDQEGNPVNLLQIFEKADPTTFLHESGHFWLEQLKADALSVGGQFDRDWNVVKNWWASRPLELREEAVRRAKKEKDKDAVAALQKMSEAQVAAYAREGNLRGEGTQRYLSVAMHEQFARGVENYFATGRAPSLSLASLFSAFRVWVSSVYSKLAGAKLDVKFSPEVTAVIDRMLAADEEISLIEGQYNLAAMYTTAEQAGMTPTQFAAYQKQVAEAKDDRRARQLSKHIKELKRARTQWWKEAREGFRDEASQQVASEPAYRLLYALTNQGLADGSTLADAERVDRMDRALLKELLEAEGFSLDDMPKVDGKAVYEDTGVSPAVVAAAFGYEDVDAMILDLVGRQPYKQSVEEAIDALMEEEHGSLESAGEAEALASAYSEKTGRVLAAELEAMRTSEPAFKQKFVRAYARDRLLNTPSAEVRPFRFLAAEGRHAKLAGEALKRGDKVEAYRHQFQRLVNHYMAAEALKAQSDIEKKTRYMRNFMKRGKKFGGIEADYVDNIMRILAAVNFGQGSAGQQSRLAEINALQDFIEERQKADGSILDVPAWLLDTTGSTANSAREMTYLRFLQLHETIKRYEKQGRAAKKIRVGAEEQDRALVKSELMAALAGRDTAAVNRLRGKSVSAEGFFYGAASAVAQVDAQLLKVEALLEAIDGKPLGVWHQAIYEPFNQAATQKYDLQAEVSQLIGGLIEALPKEVRRNFGKRVDVGALGRPGMKMTRGNLVMLALNVGNESNLDKMIRGMGGDAETNVKGAGWNINEQLIDTALEQLTQEEWNLVQAVWQHAEKLYPAVEAIYRREHGISPDRVEPRTITTKFGDIKGGYFPMMYDRTIAGVATDLSQKTAMELMQAEVGRATVNSSMTKARTGYAAPVDLDISRLALGMDNTIHFITHYEAVRNANKILGDRDVRAELEQKIGPAYADQIVKWVAALASNGNDSPPVDIIQKGMQALYNNTTVAVLGASYSTLAMQTLGLINGQDRLLADTSYGPVSIAVIQKDIAAGVAAAARPQHVQFVIEASGEMRSRRKNMDREVAQVLKNIASKEGKVAAAQRFSMEAIAQVQFYTVDIPVWTAAYNRALKAEPGDTDKAIKYADRVVRLSQSAGGLKDLAAIQRHKGIVKGLTMFYSFFSALYAVLRGTGVEFSENVRSKPIAATTRAATRLFVLLALQSVATGLVRGELPDWEPENEEDEDMLKYIVKESAATALGTLPVVRDIAAGWASGYGYNGGAGTIAFEAASKSLRGLEKIVNEMGEEEIVAKEADYEALARKYAPFVLLGGALTGLPAVQVNRTLDGLGAYFDEADDWNWTDLVRGYDAKRAARRE